MSGTRTAIGGDRGISTLTGARPQDHSTVFVADARFWAKVDRAAGPIGCWPWLGAKTQQGYGVVSRGPRRHQRTTTAIRIIFVATYGPIPPKYVIDHFECDNPPCCNPQHLRAVTQRENILRGRSPSALHAAATHCKRGHIFDLLNTGRTHQGKRYCRICRGELPTAFAVSVESYPARQLSPLAGTGSSERSRIGRM